MSEVKAPKSLIEWTIDDIISWCVANNQLEWLETESAKIVQHKVYPKVDSVSKTGKKTKKQDKTQEPTIVEEPISFIELRKSFYTTFIDSTPAKKKEPSMRDKIDAAIKAARGK